MIRHAARAAARPLISACRAGPSRRAYSAPASPWSKISAVPFKQSWDAARDRMFVQGLMASAAFPNLLYGTALNAFGMALEPFGRELGFGDSVKMKSMKAAYYPIWRVDLIAEGLVSPAQGGEERSAWLAAREAYIPGNPFAPLSYISYAVPPLPDELDLYDPKHDLHQLGEHEIIPVPFTVSPFGLIEKARREIGRRTNLDGMRIDESKWKEVMVAAYPIYFPIYLAEFEHTTGEDKRAYTLVMDGHSKSSFVCRVTFPPPPMMRERMNKNYYVNPAPFMPSANLILPVMPRSPLADPKSPTAKLTQAYQHWMTPPTDEETIPASPTLSVAEHSDGAIPWDDPRIQEWASVEHEENGEYMEKGLEVHKTIEAMNTMVSLTDDVPGDAETTMAAVGGGKHGVFKRSSVSQMRQEMQENIARLEAELDELKPHWLREYDALRAEGEKAETDKDEGKVKGKSK